MLGSTSLCFLWCLLGGSISCLAIAGVCFSWSLFQGFNKVSFMCYCLRIASLSHHILSFFFSNLFFFGFGFVSMCPHTFWFSLFPVGSWDLLNDFRVWGLCLMIGVLVLDIWGMESFRSHEHQKLEEALPVPLSDTTIFSKWISLEA